MNAVVVIGDVHIKPSNCHKIKQFTQSLITYLNDKSTALPEFVVILGDVLHHHNKVFVDCLNTAVDLFEAISRICPLVVLVGNHDMADSKEFLTKNHWMNCCKSMPRVTIIDTPRVVCSKYGFIPYVTPDRFDEACQSIVDLSGDTPVRYLFCHHEFDPAALPEIDAMIVSGHVHEKKWVGPRVYYPGSCMSSTYTVASRVKKTLCRIDSGIVSDIDLDVPRMLYVKSPVTVPVEIPSIRACDEMMLCYYGSCKDIEAFRKKNGSSYGNNVKIVYEIANETAVAVNHDGVCQQQTFLQLLEQMASVDENVYTEFKVFFNQFFIQ